MKVDEIYYSSVFRPSFHILKEVSDEEIISKKITCVNNTLIISTEKNLRINIEGKLLPTHKVHDSWLQSFIKDVFNCDLVRE